MRLYNWFKNNAEILIVTFLIVLLAITISYQIGFKSGLNNGFNQANQINKEQFESMATSSCTEDPLQFDCF